LYLSRRGSEVQKQRLIAVGTPEYLTTLLARAASNWELVEGKGRELVVR